MLVPGRQAVHGDPPSSPVSEDFSWEVLDNTRSCGIVVLMVSLSWWGKRVMANGAGLDGVRQWRNAVQEVTFAFGEVEKLKKENGEKENEDGDGDEEGEGSEVEESAVTRGKKRKQPCVPFSFSLLCQKLISSTVRRMTSLPEVHDDARING